MHWPGDKIRREREARGLSQADLAHLLSDAQTDNTTSVRSVTAWENGESRPSGRNLAALDKVFATDTGEGPTLRGATHIQLIAEFARRLGMADASTRDGIALPGDNLRLPRRRSDRSDSREGNGAAGH